MSSYRAARSRRPREATMPKFTIFWVITYVSGLFATLVNPVFGAYTYLFEYYLRPPLHWWGKGHLPDLRWNLIVSTVFLVAYLVKRNSLKDVGKPPTLPAKCLLGLLGVMFVVQQFAVNSELSWF